MPTLHTLNRSPANIQLFEQLINTIRPGDTLLLLEDGVYYCLQNKLNRKIQDIQVYALKDDVHARGIPIEQSDVVLASYEDFVNLSCENDKLVNWY